MLENLFSFALFVNSPSLPEPRQYKVYIKKMLM